MSPFKLIQAALVFFVGAVLMTQINISTGFMEMIVGAEDLPWAIDVLGHVVLGSVIYGLVFSKKPQ